MNKVKTVYCIAHSAGWYNADLTKNCGIIPMILHRKFCMKAVMLGGKTGEYPAHEKYMQDVDLEFYPDVRLETKLAYIRKNAKKIDLVVINGYAKEYTVLIPEYKRCNPEGKVFMETDANSCAQDRLHWHDERYINLFKCCDVMGVGTTVMHRVLNRKWPCVVEHIPNGFYNFMNVNMDVDFSKKKKIILTVGRIGEFPKNNELLLEAFAQVYRLIPDWKLQLVGNVTDEYKKLLEEHYEAYPGLKEQIIVSGPVYDKQKLIDIYKKASIFTLTSNSEGCPNVVYEALHTGCYMIITSVDAAKDATDNLRCGDIVPLGSVSGLAEAFIKRCADMEYLRRSGIHAIEYARRVMDYEKNISRVYYLLYGEE